ncbi:hypothetical protein HOLleu_16324 [Holothuria leucospilota]|uniref:Uncharacterized protein n=1 Tax=Holothuria leucospilota TaxID=206669 RepID=A0A9Q1C3X2_HOLLE|nr:hypothetical protein HOLleu_16324 [Holothuria leucospilota]
MSFAPSDVIMMRRQDSTKYNISRSSKRKPVSSLCFVPKGWFPSHAILMLGEASCKLSSRMPHVAFAFRATLKKGGERVWREFYPGLIK